jgi:hypothetical protein
MRYFTSILALFLVDIVVPESHLICDMRFWAGIDGVPPTLDVGVPTWDVVADEWRLYIYISRRG